MKVENKQKIINYLQELFPVAVCELDYKTPFELLVAVILSAQCTDKRVNLTTPILFERFKTVQDLANAKLEDIEQIIKPCGFYHNKAKNIKNCSIELIEKHNCIVPNTLKELTNLSGVGMKTAKVVLSTLYGENVIAVDTHVLRVSNRLGIVKESNPNKVSILLEKMFKNNLSKLHHRLVLFGRYYCKAKNPKCETCKLRNECEYYNNLLKNKL